MNNNVPRRIWLISQAKCFFKYVDEILFYTVVAYGIRVLCENKIRILYMHNVSIVLKVTLNFIEKQTY